VSERAGSVGIRPDTSLAMQAGLEIQDGILADEHLRSSDPAIFALGDCARFPSRRYGRSLRLESIQNAIDGAAAVAAAICGESLCYDPLPIISSVQFGHQLDFIGFASASCVSRRFQTDDDAALVVLREEAGRCVAVECLDAPPETMTKMRGMMADAAAGMAG
jgi:3-phenylpropionate/trans-cinnamate dioxygenase ferredoxin reductase subunit